jgi:hypothetical protein
MSETTELADLYSAIEDSARLLEVPCSRDNVWRILTAYGDTLPQAAIAFRVATGARYTGDLDWRFSVPKDVDPYAIALSNGLTAKTDHPVGTLLADLQGRYPIDLYGIDFGVVGGFKKIYPCFPTDDMQGLSSLADISSMPRSLAENLSFFARHGLDEVNVLGIDYKHSTVNVYFGALPAECREPKTILSMLREIELPDPSEQLVRLGQQAFGIYATLSWDSSRIERICFAVRTPDSTALPVRIEPKIEQFLSRVPRGVADSGLVYAAALSSAGEENYKLQSYYKWQPRVLEHMLLSDSSKNLA